METTTATPTRTVQVAPASVPVSRRLDEHGADPTNRGMSWITSRARIFEILRDGIAARNTQIQIDGSRRTLRIRLDAVRIDATRSLSGAILLQCRPEVGDFVQEPWSVGGSANIWFADATGIYSFRVKVVGGTRNALMVTQPTCIVRFCRRVDRRCAVPPGDLPRVALPLTDGTWWSGTGVRDLSTGGLRLALPPEVHLPLGRATRLGLGLHPQRFLEVTVVARHMEGDDANGLVLYGIEFVDPSNVFRMALARFMSRLVEVPGVEEESDAPRLPAAVAQQLCARSLGDVASPPPAAPPRTAAPLPAMQP